MHGTHPIAGQHCVLCGAWKPLDEFYLRDRKCKPCRREMVRENHAAKRDYYKEFDRSRAMAPHRVAARKAYAQTPEGKAALARGKQRFRQRCPTQRAANVKVGNALRDGLLKRQPCEVCGSTSRVHAHHDDHGKPLEVRWLCPAHHRAWHRGRPSGRTVVEATACLAVDATIVWREAT
jgi:hypothetical protein